MTDQRQRPLKQVTGIQWDKDVRYAVLECRHRVAVSPKLAMPERSVCDLCDPPAVPA